MFTKRKEYDIGDGKKAVSYEIVDDYQARIQLTAEQAQTLLQWLNSKATQIRYDVQGDPLDAPFSELVARWKEPKTTTIHMANGDTIRTAINGKTLDGSSGYILINGKDINVDFINGQWREQLLCSQCRKIIQELHTHTENGVKLNYCSYCYRSQFD